MILPNSPESFSNRFAAIRERIASAAERVGRKPEDVALVAVSKTFPAESIRRAFSEAGQRDFGENRIQEAVGKMEELAGDPIQWHLIGHLQTNKVNAALSPSVRFALIHSVDSVRLIEALEKRAASLDVKQPILLQLNVSGEPSKFGAPPDMMMELLDALDNAPHLKCEGLMTIPPFSENPESARPHFAHLRELLWAYLSVGKIEPKHLSMGMSGDFEIAIEEGATLVRIGSAIFGERA